MSDRIPEARARELLARLPVDKAGKVKATAAEAQAWVTDVVRALPYVEADRYGNFLWTDGNGKRNRYHFTAQRLQSQRRIGDDWSNVWSLSFKDAAQRIRVMVAKDAGDEALVVAAKEGQQARKAQKAATHLKAATKKAELVRQGRQGLQLELDHPALVRALVLDQDRAAHAQLGPLLKATEPAPAGILPTDPHRFFLSPFALTFPQAAPVGFMSDTPALGPVSVVQVPVQPTGRMVRQCDLHIGDSRSFFRVSPRSGGMSFGMGKQLEATGPGYIAATWDLDENDLKEPILRSDLFFLIAHDKRRGVGRELVKLWLDLAYTAAGGRADRLYLRIKSIVDDAWPFWEAMHTEGVYVAFDRRGSTLNIAHPALAAGFAAREQAQ